jgi:hypothetical protein
MSPCTEEVWMRVVTVGTDHAIGFAVERGIE